MTNITGELRTGFNHLINKTHLSLDFLEGYMTLPTTVSILIEEMDLWSV